MMNGRKGNLSCRARGAAHYLSRRFGNPFITGVGGAALRNGSKSAGSAMAPSRLDIGDFRTGHFGRYANGGTTRFAERLHAQGVTDAQLASRARNIGRTEVAMFLAASGFLALGAAQIATGSQGRELLFGFVTSFAAFIFLALGTRHNFGRWQIKGRRFGGFQEYLRVTGATARKH